jgi:type II restriction enzyme
MMARILDGSAPTLMLLERTPGWAVKGLTAIHGQFLTPNVIVQRKPLSVTARRAGWIGCNIRLDLIPGDGQIAVIENGLLGSKEVVRSAFRQFNRLDQISPAARGGTTLTLRVIRSLGVNVFTLGDLYREEELFLSSYPNNRTVKAKIRQQLQVLRDLGYLSFLGAGSYRLLI